MKTIITAITFLLLCGSVSATNPNDTDHYIDFYPSFNQPARTGNQPDIGSNSKDDYLAEETDSFWDLYQKQLDKRTNSSN